MIPATLAGIARHAAPRAAMETLERALITPELGVEGDCKGVFKPGKRNRRQVTLIEAGDWAAALAELGATLPWWERRANLLVEGLDLPQRAGAILRIGGVRLEITTECDPCERMDALIPGLRAALRPDWRGGACARVLSGGMVAIGDTIEIESFGELAA
ncbi:MOSC domain-containing protein [Sphingomonas sp.]|uniref:MOSC domain-containing protein n=1 Tax=Sphingomonas sp. TaxID=28214 RepID=UPI002600BF26|nr:MOSC domain-containing protein [Sphingomonas sp.]